jgi:hypothetical protein
LEKILWAALATLAGGVVLFSVTTLLKIIFEPLLTLRKTLGEVSYYVQYHAWVFYGGRETVPKERFEKTFDDVRSVTARLRANAYAVKGYNFFSELGCIPPYQNIVKASGHLIRISNELGRQDPLMSEDLKAVASLLQIDIGRPNFKPEDLKNLED